MKSSNTSVAEMLKTKDFSFGYVYEEGTKETRRVPTRDLPAIAPAGAINSSARDMAQWLRLMLGGGVFEGKRLVSEKSFGLQDLNTYTFLVHPDANKTEIKLAIQSIFSVKVKSVNTLNRPGKRKRTRQVVGFRKATKRALVTLHAGDKIEIFEGA